MCLQNLKPGSAQQVDGAQSDSRLDGGIKGPVEGGALRRELEIYTISFSKVKNSLGLSIVAAKVSFCLSASLSTLLNEV